MKPISVTIASFLAFGEERTITFNDGLTAITGPNKAGKSSIFRAIMWALFGAAALREAGVTQKQAVHEGMDRARVELHFSVGGSDYAVSREHLASGTTKLDLMVNDPEHDAEVISGGVNSETQAMINALVGEYAVAEQSWYCGQDADKSFMFAKPAERMETFSALLPSTVNWEKIHDSVRQRRGDLSAGHEILLSRFTVLGEQTAGIDGLREEAALAAADLREVREDLQADLDALDPLLKEPQLIRDARAQYVGNQALRTAQQNVNDALTEAEQSKGALVWAAEKVIARKEEIEARASREVEQAKAIEDHNEKADARQVLISQHKLAVQIGLAEKRVIDHVADGRANQLHRIRDEITEIRESDACPTCGRTYDETTNDHIKAAVQAKEQEYKDAYAALELKREALTDEAKALKAQRDVTIEVDVTKPEPETIARYRGQIGDEEGRKLMAALKLAEEQIDGHRKEYAEAVEATRAGERELEALPVVTLEGVPPEEDIAKAETAIAVQQGIVAEARETVDTAMAANARATERVEAATGALSTLHEAQTALEGSQRALNDWEALMRATGPRGIRQIMVDQSLGGINSTVNRVLEILDPGSYLYLDTQREAGDGSQAETLEATIVGPDGINVFGTRSGAEKTRLAIAVRVALEVARAQSVGASHNATMIIDEAFGAQDAAGKDNFGRFLRWLVDDLGVNVLIVTHDAEMRERFDQTIEVRKVDGQAVVS